jgi:hypothetical protein
VRDDIPPTGGRSLTRRPEGARVAASAIQGRPLWPVPGPRSGDGFAPCPVGPCFGRPSPRRRLPAGHRRGRPSLPPYASDRASATVVPGGATDKSPQSRYEPPNSSTTDPHTACPVPNVLPEPWAVLRGTDRPMLETAFGVGTKLPRVLARTLDPDLTMPQTGRPRRPDHLGARHRRPDPPRRRRPQPLRGPAADWPATGPGGGRRWC